MGNWRGCAVIAIGLCLVGCPAPGQTGGSNSSGSGSGSGSASGSASIGISAASGGTAESTEIAVNAIASAEFSGVESCAQGDDVAGNMAIGKAFEDSMHELVVCGGMAIRFSLSFINVFVNLARGNPTQPEGFEHVGNGRYKVGDVMNVVTTTPFATSFAAAGEPIPFDVFDAGNYFARIAIKSSASFSLGGSAETKTRFVVEDPQPGLELLGEVDASGEISITWDDVLERFGAIGITQEIKVADERGSATVIYDATSASVPVRNFLFAAGGAGITINSATVTDASRGQTLTVTDFAMEFTGGSVGTMDGHVDFEVRGGDFDWNGRFEYPHRKDPDITISCP